MNVAISPRQFEAALSVVPESAVPVLETICSRTAKDILPLVGLRAPSINVKPLVGALWPTL
jgi:hypothetical protein